MAVHSLSVSHSSRSWCEQGTIIQSKNGKAWDFGKGEIEEKIDVEGRWVVFIAGCDKRGKRFTEGSLPCCRICLYLTPRVNNEGHGVIFTHKHRKLGDTFIKLLFVRSRVPRPRQAASKYSIVGYQPIVSAGPRVLLMGCWNHSNWGGHGGSSCLIARILRY